MRPRLLPALILSLWVTACSTAPGAAVDLGTEDPSHTTAGSRVAGLKVEVADSSPLIVELVGRHGSIRVTAAPKAPLYSLWSTGGTQLTASMTLREIAAFNPSLHRQLKSAVATEAGTQSFLWAGM